MIHRNYSKLKTYKYSLKADSQYISTNKKQPVSSFNKKRESRKRQSMYTCEKRLVFQAVLRQSQTKNIEIKQIQKKGGKHYKH